LLPWLLLTVLQAAVFSFSAFVYLNSFFFFFFPMQRTVLRPSALCDPENYIPYFVTAWPGVKQ
jgi:hypothetical protein